VQKKYSKQYLISGEDSEGVDNLFGSVDIGGFAGHEVKEGIKVYKTSRVRIDSGQDALEVDFTLRKINLSNFDQSFYNLLLTCLSFPML